MKRIVLFCEALQNRAGIERMTVELANLLVGTYEVFIVTIDPFSNESCPYPVNTEVKVISLISQFSKNFVSLNLGNIRKLRRILKEIRPHVIITVATPLVRISAPASIGLNIKNIGWEHFNINAGTKFGRFYKLWATKWVDATVSLTDADAREYLAHGGKRVLTIPNFTSIGDNAPSKFENKVVLAVGRHVPQKGFDMLIRAWAKALAPGWKLRIVGEGDDKDKNMALARDLGVMDSIEFGASTPRIEKEFQNASCFVLSSRFEGLVLVLIEAKMMGLPCISFDCPESPREVLHDGIDGVLVPPEDVDALAKAISFSLKDAIRLRQMGAMAREDALKRYSPNAIKNQWIELIERR